MTKLKTQDLTPLAVVLMSGGLDSTTTLYYARSTGYKPYALIFDYGQRHRKEISSAKKIVKLTNTPYSIIKFNLLKKGSSLINRNIRVPSGKLKRTDNIVPSTYVPARNTIFLSFALSFAETLNAEAIFIGANAVDFSGYPDCKPEYYKAFRKVVRLGTVKRKIKILTPFINKSKSEIIKKGLKLKVPFQLTWSCYQGKNKSCQKCDSCILRAKGFRKAGVVDPLLKNG